MAGPTWNTRPEAYCQQAKQRAIRALHRKNHTGLTALEKAYLKAMKQGRIPTTDPTKEYPYYETF